MDCGQPAVIRNVPSPNASLSVTLSPICHPLFTIRRRTELMPVD
jgi:hypothetical protein